MDNQQLKARFFGMHTGCKIRYTNVFGSGEYDSAGVFLDGDSKWKLRMTDCGVVRLDDCKLILRPLSSITDEEVKGLVRLPGIYDGEPDSDISEVVGYIATILREKEFNLLEDTAVAYDYLRSIGICVPFMGIDPVAEGWAILEEH